jgi:hypothetical protein
MERLLRAAVRAALLVATISAVGIGVPMFLTWSTGTLPELEWGMASRGVLLLWLGFTFVVWAAD